MEKLSFGENNKLGILEYLVFAISLMYLPVLGPSSQARAALHLVLSRISDSPQSCLSCRELEPVELRDVGGRNQFPFRWTEETDDITHLLFRLSRLNQYPDWLLLFLLAPFREIHCRKWTAHYHQKYSRLSSCDWNHVCTSYQVMPGL